MVGGAPNFHAMRNFDLELRQFSGLSTNLTYLKKWHKWISMIHVIKTHNVNNCKNVWKKRVGGSKEKENILFIISYLKSILLVAFSPLGCCSQSLPWNGPLGKQIHKKKLIEMSHFPCVHIIPQNLTKSFSQSNMEIALIEWCKEQIEPMQPCGATKHSCVNNWTHIHSCILKSHVRKKDASAWEYVLATRVSSYSTKDPMLAHLLA